VPFSGNNSAPHPLVSKIKTKSGQAVPAGVFTQPFATQLIILALKEAIRRGVLEVNEVTQDQLEQFLGRSERRFYKLPNPATEGKPKIILKRKGEIIPTSIKSADGTLKVELLKSITPIFSLSWLT
jgi:dihydroorotase